MKKSIAFALSAIRGELLESEREKERDKERYSFGILKTGYLLSMLKIMREIEREKEREKERERKE